MPSNLWLISHGKDSYDTRPDLIYVAPNRQLVDKIKPKDYVIYYLTGEKKIIGTFEVVKEVFNGDQEFESNWRTDSKQFLIKKRIVKSENPLPVDRILRRQLTYFGGSRRNWGRLVQNSVNRIRYLQDFEIIEDLLKKR